MELSTETYKEIRLGNQENKSQGSIDVPPEVIIGENTNDEKEMKNFEERGKVK